MQMLSIVRPVCVVKDDLGPHTGCANERVRPVRSALSRGVRVRLCPRSRRGLTLTFLFRPSYGRRAVRSEAGYTAARAPICKTTPAGAETENVREYGVRSATSDAHHHFAPRPLAPFSGRRSSPLPFQEGKTCTGDAKAGNAHSSVREVVLRLSGERAVRFWHRPFAGLLSAG
jgi:hypothetical protein